MATYNIKKRSDMIDINSIRNYCGQLKSRSEELIEIADNIGKQASNVTEEVLSIGGKTPGAAFDEVIEYLKSQASALNEYAEAAEERATEIYNEQDRYITDLENANTNTVALSDQSMAVYNNDVTNTVGGNSTNTVGNTVVY